MQSAEVLQGFASAWTAKHHVHVEPGRLSGLVGRIARGRAGREEDFAYLGPTYRRLAWVLGAEDLLKLLSIRRGPGGDAAAILALGKDLPWLQGLLDAGQWQWRLQLVVSKHVAPELGDWAGVRRMIQRVFPDAIVQKLAPHWNVLEAACTPAQVRALLGSDLYELACKQKDFDMPHHMSEQRYLSADDTVANARVFLWHSMGMNEHFQGDGRTTGGLSEYLAPNCMLSSASLQTVHTSPGQALSYVSVVLRPEASLNELLCITPACLTPTAT
jgi:hypothetical protein